MLSTIIAQRILTKYPTKIKMVTPRLLCTIILLHNPTSSSSFIIAPNGSGYGHKRLLFATSASVEGITTNKNNNPNMFSESTHNPPKSMKKITKDNVITNNLVVVNRNKQSLEFKNGSPLVFSGAISHTIEKNLNINDIDNNGLVEASSSSSSTLPMCSLVCLLVSREDDNSNKNNKSKKYGKSKKPTTYPHYKISDINDNNTNVDLKSLQIIGYGIYNPSSMYRVRLLCHESVHPNLCSKLQKESADYNGENKERYLIETIITDKIKTAVRVRKYLNLPNKETDTFRLLNNEGDGLSGLCVDVLGSNVMVVMSSAAWCEYYKDSIISVLKNEVANEFIGNKDMEVIWRSTNSRLKQDGYDDYDSDGSNASVHDDKKDSSVILKENNVSYKVYPYSDNVQKTGFYCDQRVNRQTVASLCAGKDVLDLCCFNGSFSLNAALANAKSATGIDSSADAISSANDNAIVNSLQDTCTFTQADVEDYMKKCIEEQKYFDVIILDPPKLAPTLSSLTKATRKYKQLNKFALQLIHPTNGGLLASCSCSSAMSQKDGGEYFIKMIREASLIAKRDITLLSVDGASPCHTQNVAGFPKSGKYLTVALFHVAPVSG